jgi:hypothetical protein
MTKKDYQAFAKMFSDVGPEYGSNAWEELVERAADIFARDNSRFDRDRFRAACGVTSR